MREGNVFIVVCDSVPVKEGDPFPSLVRPITANGNQLHMRFFIGMCSAALIPPEYVIL